MKNIISILIVFLAGQFALAQSYPMTSANNGATFNTCSGTFTDDNPTGNYGNNISNRTITFCPDNPDDLLRFNFTSFHTENNFDVLEVFYGDEAVGAPAQAFTGNLGAFVFFSAIPGDCVTFRFKSDGSVSYAGWSAGISCVTPCEPPTAAMVDDSTVDICSSEAVNGGDLTVVFDASNSYSNDSSNVVSYEWNWGDGTTSVVNTPITTHTFPDEPGIYTVSLKVRTDNTGTNPDGCLSSNTVVRYIRVLPPPNFDGTSEGPFTLDCGDSLTLTGIAGSQTVTQAPPIGSGSDVVLPDTQNFPFDSTIDLTGYFPPGAVVTAECLPELTFNIEHSFAGDLRIFLIAPTGQQVILMDGYAGGPGDSNNLGGTKLGYCVNGGEGTGPGCFAPYHIVASGGLVWTNAASETNYTQSCSTYTGTCESGSYFRQDENFNPSQPMTNLVGAELNGVWTLRIIDYWAIDDGYLDSWSIRFPGDCYVDLETETPLLSGGLWSGGGPAVPEPQVVTDTPIIPTGVDPCPGDADCTGNQLENTVTVGPFTNGGTFTYTFTVTDEFGCEFQREVVVNVDCPCSLELTSANGTDDQAICIGDSIVDITYEAGGNATGVVVTGLPDGVTWVFTDGELIISGTPTETGTFNYSVTTTGCEDDITLTGTITVNELPEITPITVPLEFCTDSTTTYDFDLTQVEDDLVPNPGDYNFTYYESEADAEVPQNNITTPTTYPIPVSATTTVYIRVEDMATGCYVITNITIQPGTTVTLTAPNPIQLCDDDFDGVFEYDLPDMNNLLIVSTTGLTFSYHTSFVNAQNNNPIPAGQWNDYEFTTLPASLWVVATNADGCRSEIVEVEFEEGQGINLLAGPYEIPFCEDEPVNLTQFHNNYTNETGVIFTYYGTLANAQNEISPLSGVTNYNVPAPGMIYIRLEKNNRCPEIIEVEFVAGQEIQHNNGPFGSIEYCEGFAIDLTEFESDMTSETGVTFTYYATLSNAEDEVNPITNEADYEADGDGTIYVRLEKSGRCAVILSLTYEERPSPSIEGLEPLQRVICDGDTIEVEASSDDTTANYVWEWGNQTLNSPVITITEPGIYTLTVTGDNGCESSEQLVVTAAAQPTITSVESGTDYLIVYVQSGGGLLEYSLNGVIWQSSPRFDNLVKGETYTVYVREDGCMIDSYKVVILSVPNFVSPNGDGYNDVWEVRGIEVTPKATIKIFDRYGKIFVDTNFDGNYVWDGKYMGNPLPSGDYWYIMDIPSDGVVKAKKFVGHVSIRN